MCWGEESPLAGETPQTWQVWSADGGSPIIVGDLDWGKLGLSPLDEALGPVVDLSNSYERFFSITQNLYGSGSGSFTSYIRYSDTSFNQEDGTPSWNLYAGATNITCRYVQIKLVGG